MEFLGKKTAELKTAKQKSGICHEDKDKLEQKLLFDEQRKTVQIQNGMIS